MSEEEAFEIAEQHFMKYKDICNAAGIPYHIFIHTTLVHLIMAYSIEGITNIQFLEIMEDTWYQISPLINAKLKEKKNALS